MERKIIDDKTYYKFKNKVGIVLKKYPNLNLDQEDIAHELFINWLEGKSKHQTVDQFVIDYLRRYSGRKGTSRYQQGFNPHKGWAYLRKFNFNSR